MKMTLWTGLCLFITAAITIAYAAFSLRDTAINTAKQQAIAVASANAISVNEDIEVALNTARTLAQLLSTVKDTEHTIDLDRDQVMEMLRKILVENTQLVGVFTVWEPNAFDDKDAQFVNAEGHDQTGRFVPYWSRDVQGNITIAPRVGYSSEGIGDYYQRPKQTRLEHIADPYYYPVQGTDVMITSLVVPIIVEGEFYGVVGVDIRLEFFQRLADAVNIYDGHGSLSLITYQGTIAAATDQPELIGKPAEVLYPNFESSEKLEFIRQGNTVVEFNGDNHLEVFVPIHFWRILFPWAVGINVPGEHITAEANMLMWQMIGIGVTLTLGALVLLWGIAKQISVPIKKVTNVAHCVASGNLEVTADVRTNDETGVLANAFNQMIGSLREMMEHDRKANEELTRQNSEQKRLLDLVTTLETPVIPLVDGLLFAPIVGVLDSRRADMLTNRLLNDVHEKGARHVVLDVTGVSTIDTQVARVLVQTAQALRLLGCTITITGISPSVATTITELGIHLDAVANTQSLQEVLVAFSQHMKQFNQYPEHTGEKHPHGHSHRDSSLPHASHQRQLAEMLRKM